MGLAECQEFTPSRYDVPESVMCNLLHRLVLVCPGSELFAFFL